MDVLCPQCRADVPPAARFCPSCGHELVVVGDQRRIASVLFADLVGFTALSETLDPEQVKALVDRCFAQLAVDIESFGGRVDKVVGDGIVALFGAPVAHEDDAERAVRAGLRMQESMARLTAEVGDPVLMRVGITTGEVLVGAVSGGREYTAMGDVVNTASRLQTAAEPGSVLVDAATYAATSSAVEFDAHDAITAKGKDAPVEVWVARRAVAPPGRRRRPETVPMVGRDDELALLTSVTAIAIERSRASIQLVHGEAGMGKSRLAEESMRFAREELGAATLEGRCVPYGEANVWWPVADALRSAAGLDAAADAATVYEGVRRLAAASLRRSGREDELERVVAGLHLLLAHDGSRRDLDRNRARDEAIRSVVAVTEGFTYAGPVMFVFSDLHWADQVVLDLVDTLLTRLARRPFVLLATARRGLQDRWTPSPSTANAVSLHLDPLDGPASERLLSMLVAETTTDPGLGRLLIERSGGNPFYLEELVSLVRDAGADTAQELAASENGELPGTLRGLVAARLDGLSPSERSTLDDAAVLGRRNTVSGLATMIEVKRGFDSEEGRALIEALAAREFLVLDGDFYTFRSDVIREVAYSTLTKADRARAHAGIAAWLVDHPKDDDHRAPMDAVASHYAAAAELVHEIGDVAGVPGDVDEQALSWLHRAIDEARRNFAPTLVVSLADRALALAAADDPRRAELLRRRADSLAELYRVDEAEADVAAALAVSAETGDSQAEAQTQLVAANLARHRGDPGAAVERALAALAAFTAVGDDQGRADALRQLGQAQIFAGRFVEAEETLQQALTCTQALADDRGVAWTQQHLAWTAFVSGDIDTAQRRLDAAVATFAAMGDHGGLTWSRGLLAWVRFHQGRNAEARELAREVGSDAAERDERWGAAMMGVLDGVIALWDGRTTEAINTLASASGELRDIDDPFGTLQAMGALGRARVMSGDAAGGERAFLSARRFNTEHGGDEAAAGMLDLIELCGAVHVGDVDRAAVLAPKVEASVDERAFPGDRSIALALHALQTGDLDRARRLIDEVDAERGYALAVAALAAAVGGDVEAVDKLARRTARAVHTYVDSAMASVARALAHAGAGAHEESERALAEAESAAGATDDLAARAAVAIVAEAIADARGSGADATRAAAESATARAQMSGAGWHTLANAALQTVSPAAG